MTHFYYQRDKFRRESLQSAQIESPYACTFKRDGDYLHFYQNEACGRQSIFIKGKNFLKVHFEVPQGDFRPIQMLRIPFSNKDFFEE